MSAPKVIKLRQGSVAWEEWRRSHIGASDAPVIVGESPYTSPLELYAEKIGPRVAPDADTARLFRIGHAMEPVALALYEEETGRKVRKGRVLESREHPWQSASLDGETPGRIIEAKWTSSARWDDGVPGDVLVQVTHQMGVAQVQVADVAVLTPRSFVVYEVPFDATLWAEILVLEMDFDERVRARIPPSPDGSESSRRGISRLFPEDTGVILPGDPEMSLLVRSFLDAQSREKAAKAEVDAAGNALRFLIGEASGIDGSGWKVTYKQAKGSQRTDWAGYASSLEGIIGESLPDRMEEVETIKSICTTATEGSRRLLVRSTTEEVSG